MKVNQVGQLTMTTLLPLALLLSIAALAWPAWAAPDASDTTWDGSEPPQGIYFYWYEPSFYAGFAPRTQDPQRLHLRLSRGNQVRVTVVLGEKELDAYLDDLVQRQRTYQELIDTKVIELTTNREYERFVERLNQAGVSDAVKSRNNLGPTAYRQKSLEIMTALNPERVFRITMRVDGALTRWHAQLAGMSPDDLASPVKQLDAANAILPGRVNLYTLSRELTSSLSRAVELADKEKAAARVFREQALAFLERATAGHYRAHDAAIEAVEFTTIYPAGTIDATTTYKGEKLPTFGVTGVWPLIRRIEGRGINGMV